MWKLLTDIVVDEIYNHLQENDLLKEEQKGYRRGTKNQLLISKAVIKKKGWVYHGLDRLLKGL